MRSDTHLKGRVISPPAEQDGADQRIQVRVESRYLEAHSDPKLGEYRFAYTITITNRGTVTARLLRRRWLIQDDDGREEVVEGEGVVGEQPRLKPGESFRYTSFSLLQTPHGTMEGHYEWSDDQGRSFISPIAPFYLSVPRVLH